MGPPQGLDTCSVKPDSKSKNAKTDQLNKKNKGMDRGLYSLGNLSV